jgi:DNA-binding transcriptional LysR family regulator
MLLGDARRLLQLEEAARRRLTAPPLSGTVRLGAVEEVAGGSLPRALGRFASSHPNVKLEVQIGVSSPLIEQLDAGRLDVVFAKRFRARRTAPRACRRGRPGRPENAWRHPPAQRGRPSRCASSRENRSNLANRMIVLNCLIKMK